MTHVAGKPHWVLIIRGSRDSVSCTNVFKIIFYDMLRCDILKRVCLEKLVLRTRLLSVIEALCGS